MATNRFIQSEVNYTLVRDTFEATKGKYLMQQKVTY